MAWIGWMGLALGMVMVTASKIGPPPVIVDLGPVVPTPNPTPKYEQKKRLITTITVQNTVEGETVVSFEATDFADQGGSKTHVIASKSYSLAEEKSELKESREKIMLDVRALERQLLKHAELAGPPKPREPVMGPGGSGGQPPR
jgi:hypothetical protein